MRRGWQTPAGDVLHAPVPATVVGSHGTPLEILTVAVGILTTRTIEIVRGLSVDMQTEPWLIVLTAFHATFAVDERYGTCTTVAMAVVDETTWLTPLYNRSGIGSRRCCNGLSDRLFGMSIGFTNCGLKPSELGGNSGRRGGGVDEWAISRSNGQCEHRQQGDHTQKKRTAHTHREKG